MLVINLLMEFFVAGLKKPEILHIHMYFNLHFRDCSMFRVPRCGYLSLFTIGINALGEQPDIVEDRVTFRVQCSVFRVVGLKSSAKRLTASN